MIQVIQKKQATNRGFTLMELLVVCAIIVVIDAAILFNNNKFGGRVLLENFAYDMALTVRQAQVYGISVSRFGSNTFSAGYGMHFDMASSTSYILFADATTPDGMYTPTTELVQTYNINQGYKIKELCATVFAVETCSYTTLDVLFKRPEPDAYISAGGASCILSPTTNCQDTARIQLISPRGETMSVEVFSNGQITILST